MQIKTTTIQFSTHGHNHIVNITDSLDEVLNDSGMSMGSILISAVGSTTGITTLEFEPGLVGHDVNEMFELFAPYKKSYRHNQTWHDDNGAAHLRSTLIGTSMTVPVVDGRMILGTWQQVVFMDFDTRPRDRTVVVQLTGMFESNA